MQWSQFRKHLTFPLGPDRQHHFRYRRDYHLRRHLLLWRGTGGRSGQCALCWHQDQDVYKRQAMLHHSIYCIFIVVFSMFFSVFFLSQNIFANYTIEQYKIQRFLDETFAMEHFLVSQLSRTSLLLEDETGEQLAFGFLDDEVREIPLPPPADLEKIKDFILSLIHILPQDPAD